MFTQIKKVVCPKCSQVFDAKLYLSVNVTNHPRLRDDILDKSLFRWRCKSCGQQALLTYPVLYNNMRSRFMVYMIPEIDRFQLIDREVEEEYYKVKQVRKRIVPDLNSFKEKIFILESGLDDMAIEITKLAISETVANKFNLRKVTEGYLSNYEREENSLTFTFFVGKDKVPYTQKARLEIYGKSMSIVNDLAIRDRSIEGFIKVDREWAKNVLYRYKRLKEEQLKI